MMLNVKLHPLPTKKRTGRLLPTIERLSKNGICGFIARVRIGLPRSLWVRGTVSGTFIVNKGIWQEF